MVDVSFYAPEDIHSILREHQPQNEYEFVLTSSENGKKRSSKLELSIDAVYSTITSLGGFTSLIPVRIQKNTKGQQWPFYYLDNRIE